MEEINGKEAKITTINTNSFKIDLDTSKFSGYVDRGRITEVKQPHEFQFVDLKESWENYQVFLPPLCSSLPSF
jgi:Ubiquitin-activating enzyme E1 FCCH domain